MHTYKSNLFLLLIAIFMVANVQSAAICEADNDGECFYASPEGLADAICSADEPCTIEAATQKLSGGDFLYLLSGTYTEHYANYDLRALINFDKFFNFQDPQPSAESPVTVKSLEPKQAIIQGDSSAICIVIDKDYIRFDGLVVRNCDGTGMRIRSDIDGHHITVSNSLFEDIAGSDNMGGIVIGNAAGAIIENNEFRGMRPSTSANGNCNSLMLFQASDVTIRNNYFHDTCAGINFKHGERSEGVGGFTKIHGNTFINLDRGLAIESNQNRTEIYNNVLIGSGINIHNENGTRPQFTYYSVIQSNTIVDGYVTLNHGSNDGSYLDGYGLGAKLTTVKNNIFYDTEYNIWPYGADQDFIDGVGLTSDNNCFHQTGSTQSIGYFSNAGSFGDLGDDYPLERFKTEVGFDINSVEFEPVFIDVAASDYRLAHDSPCQEMGITSDAEPAMPDNTPEPESESPMQVDENPQNSGGGATSIVWLMVLFLILVIHRRRLSTFHSE